MIRALPLLLLAACTAPIGGDNDTVDDTDDHDPVRHSHAVVTTTDFAVGGLSTVALDVFTVADDLVPTSADPTVQVQGGRVFQINGFGVDTVTVYAPGQWTAPVAQFSTGSGTNPHRVALHDEGLFVSLYERDALGVFGAADGASLGTVDLSAYAGSDGIPEASTMVVIGDRIYVALERLNRDDGWGDDGGRVVAVDALTRDVVQSWEVGPSPQVYPHPSDPTALIVRTGSYGNLDGGLAVLHPTKGAPEAPFVTTEDLGYSIAAYAGAASGQGVIVAEHADFTYALKCVSLDGEVTDLFGPTADWITGPAVDDQGRAWVAVRSFAGPSGLLVADVDACEVLEERIETALPPYRIAFY